MKFILARKVGMTSVFDAEGAAVPVTVLQAGPCVVTTIKQTERDGYEAVQIGFGETKKLSKSVAGQLKAVKAKPRKLAEFRVEDTSEYKVGDKINVDTFAEGEKVTVSAVSRGKGFAGTIKRHNFHRGPKTHGSRNYRAPGSIGAGYPQHVFRGQKMAGHMGGERVTTKNLPVIRIDASENLIAIRGAVPGPKRGIVALKTNGSATKTEEASE